MYKKTSANHGNRLAKKEEKFNDFMSIYWPNLPFYNDTIWPGKKSANVSKSQWLNGSFFEFHCKIVYNLFYPNTLFAKRNCITWTLDKQRYLYRFVVCAILSTKSNCISIFFHFSFILYASIYYNWKCRETD